MSRWLRELRWALEFVLIWPVLALLSVMTPYWVDVTVKIGGYLSYWFLVRERKWALLNLRFVFGDNLDDAQRRRLAICSFEHQMLMICEILRADRRWIARNVVIDGLEHLLALLAAGRGYVVLAGHLGNHEIFAAAFAARGIHCSVMSRPLDNPYLQRYLQFCRGRFGQRSISRDRGGLRDVLRLLKSYAGVGIAIDQNMTRDGVFVDFFGIPAATARGPAAIALRSGCAVTLLVAVREANGVHRMIVNPPMQLLRSGDEERDIRDNMQMFTNALEPFIERYPEQYRWGYGRWRTRPDGSGWECDARYEELVKHRKGEPRMPPPPRWQRKGGTS